MSFSNADLLSISEITTRCTLEIPEFQRGYSWQKEQWEALWGDVESVVTRGTTEHYTGTLMLGTSDANGVSELIDGQQRMVTIALMISALGGAAYPIKFRNNTVLQDCFDFHALGQRQLEATVSHHLSYYARNIGLAWNFFADRASGIRQADAAQPYLDVLLNRLRIFVLTISAQFDVHVAFETINNRGRPLSTLEKLKNRLIYLASLDQDVARGKQAASEVHRCWKGIYQSLGAGKQLLQDDAFLSAHSTGWFRVERVYDWLNVQLFDKEFSTRQAVDSAGIVAYVQSLDQAAACWHLLHAPERLPATVAAHIHRLNQTAEGATPPLLLWALVRIAREYPAFLLDPGKDTGWAAAFAALVSEAERFGALVLQAADRPAHTGKSDLNRSAYAMANDDPSVLTRNALLVPASNAVGALEIATQHLHSLISNVRGEDEEGEEILTHPQFDWQGYFSAEGVLASVNDRFAKKGGTGFYGWSFGKLVVMAWEERLRGYRGKQDKKPWERFHWTDSVEHIYPQTSNEYWEQSIITKGRNGDKSAAAIAGSLGNLLLLSGPLNSVNSNHAYQTVGDTQGKRSRYASGSYSEIQISELCERWTVVEIAARGIAMLQNAQRRWGFELLPPDAKEVDWLPYLFGPFAERVSSGHFTKNKKAVDGRNLRSLVERFNTYK
ncbi:DUF262 domain-containing protein [Xanthomonas sp. 3058]|uniref:DUF262 domain-containing protein n=1 Tax=Xanthomonas sp. 3058 TaxID=3035314 RepID=UPI001615638D|nr:DUF262 domain-containing protein [Xanthomonas sp. 3058]MBB5866480.1 hypothetical protein [Xanthomonas sp. 3058]